MEFLEAAIAVLREEGRPLHWTAIQDIALKRGYLDPFVQRDLRRNLLTALSSGARDGVLQRDGKGTYTLR
jgi:hypothetical protein